MGRILHRQLMRRQFGLVSQQPAQGFSLEDRRWLQTQGIDRPDQLPRKSLWYKPDGTSSLGPSDPYHLARYRQRGMTLKPPTITPESVHREPMPLVAKKVLRVLGEDQRWEGSASELAAIIGSRTPTGLSRALGTPKVTGALSAAGVTVRRGYRGKGRVLLVVRERPRTCDPRE
jgi:hypothetical protein